MLLKNVQKKICKIKETFWIQFYAGKGCKLMNVVFYRGSAIEKLEREITDATKRIRTGIK